MIRTRAQETVVTVTAEVVTLAELARHDLLRILPRKTLTFATDAVTTVVAQSLGGVVGSTPSLPLSLKTEIFFFNLSSNIFVAETYLKVDVSS